MIRFRAATIALGLAASLWASAQPQTYAGRSAPVRVGVLLTEPLLAGGELANPAPHAWGNLDREGIVKPREWDLVNPVAPTALTNDLRARWINNIARYGGPSGVPDAGSRIDKRHGAYWEVPLQITGDDALARFDVLLMPVDELVALNPLQREKLRRFMDQGGVLWVDVVGDADADAYNPAPLPFGLSGGGLTNPFVYEAHPLASTPNPVTVDDFQLLTYAASTSIAPAWPGGALGPLQAWLTTDYAKFTPIVYDASGNALCVVGQAGEGYMVVTAGGVSQILNRGAGGNPNVGYRSLNPATDAQFTVAAKLAVNIVSLASGYTTTAGGTRRQSSRGVDLQPPLFRRFGLNGAPTGPPVLYNGRMIMSSGGRVLVLDANPSDDLDGDGNPDDGIPDGLSTGADVIWSSAALGGISPPTVAEVPQSSTPVQILVTDSSGQLHVFPLNAMGTDVPAIATVSPPSASVGSPGGPYAPQVHEGIAYVTDSMTASNGNTLGRIWAADLSRAGTGGELKIRSSRNWAVENAGRLAQPTAGATIGYIPVADASGALDKVAYVPLRANGTDRPAGIVSVWIGSRGEVPVDVTPSGTNLLVTTRAALNNLPVYLPTGPNAVPSLGVKLSVVDPATGRPFNTATLNSWFTGSVSESSPGQINVQLTSAGSGRIWEGPGQNASLRIDYSIDWGAATSSTPSEAYVRGDLLFADDSNYGRQVRGQVALSNQGNLFVVTGRDGATAGGSVYALREEGRGEFRMIYRWDLHERLSFSVNQSGGNPQTIQYAPAIVDYDGLLGFPGFGSFLDVPMQNLRFTTGPTVRGDTVYVAASSGKGGFLAAAGPICTALLAFDANPAPPEFIVDGLSGSFALVQPDVTRSSNQSQPELLSALQPGQFQIENVEGVTNRRKVRIENMMSVRRGRIRDSLSTNLPVILRQGGQPDAVIEPEAIEPDGIMTPGLAAGKWSPLRWYTVFNGYVASAQPVVNGSMLYIGGGSYLPALLAGQFPPTTTRGLLYGMDTNVAPSDLKSPNFQRNWMVSQGIAPRPWELYLSQIEWLAGDVRPSPYFLWPQNTGITTFADFRLRVRQATLEEPAVDGMVAGQGTLGAWAGGRTYAFQRADFLVADEGRIGRFDASGNPIWTTEATLSSGREGPTGVAGKTIQLSLPSRVYASGENAFWVVDSGNDRILRVDSAGRELRSLSRFKVDPNFAPTGLPENAPRSLRLPKDVITYRSIVARANNPFTNAQTHEVWQHYLIADSGNFRVIEVVDRYAYDINTGANRGVVAYNDPNSSAPGGTERALGVLLWHIRPELAGKQFAYNSIDRTFIPDPSGTTRIPIYGFGFGNLEPGRSTFGLDTGPTPELDRSSGSGGIVLYNPANGASEVITRFAVPSMSQLWNFTADAWTGSRQAVPDQRIQGLTSVALRYTSAGTAWPSVMFTDVTGVWEIEGAAGSWSARWALPNEVYRVMRRFTTGPNAGEPSPRNPQNLRATYARRLESGEVIVTNGYFGRTRGGEPFGGEVVLLYGGDGGAGTERGFDWSARNLGFDNFMINFELPPLSGARGLVAPQFAARR